MAALLVVYLLALAMSWAGSQGGASAAGVPVFAWCALLAFGLQWLAFVPAYLRQTEKFYDLTGSFSFVSCVLLALALSGPVDGRSVLLASCVVIWAARLGSFLFTRISQDGSDSRFDAIKPDPLRFFLTWSLQGFWVLLTAGAALAAISGAEAVPLSPVDAIGAGLWLTGLAIEAVADRQKRIFRSIHGPDKFIHSGLWSRSRHPNYLGEILLWTGVAVLAFPALQGWQLITLVSPVFVYFLLTRVSGVPLLERKADQKWAGQADYEAYKDSTPVLFPKLL